MLPREAGMSDPAARLPEPASPPGVPPAHGTLVEAGRGGGLILPPPPALSSGPDAWSLLRSLRRRWLMALSLGLLAAGGAAAAVWFLLPASYMVFAQLQIHSVPPVVLGDGRENRSESMTYHKTQMDRIRSRNVILAALKRDEVKRLDAIANRQSDPAALISWLEEELKVQSLEGSELVTVFMMGRDPTELVPLINGIVQAYLLDVEGKERERRDNRLRVLDEVYTNLKETLRKKRVDWHEQAEKLNTSSSQALTQKQIILLNTFGELRKQHSQVRFDLMRARNQLEAHKGQEKQPDEMPVPESALSEALDADPGVHKLLEKIARWDEFIAQGERTYRDPNWPSLREARSHRQSLQQKLDDRRKEMRGELEQRFRQRARAQYDQYLAQLQHEIGPLERQEEDLRQEVEGLKAEVVTIGNSSTALQMLADDIREDDKNATRVGDELEKLRVELRSSPRVSQYQEAGAQRKDRKRQLMALIAAPVLAFLGVCLAVAWWEFRGRRIHTPDEVLTGLGLRVVGAVPALSRQASVPLLAGPGEADGFDHGLLESIDGIRTLLLRDASRQETRVLMVTSAVGGEGKTTLATHLAGSLARAGRRTLLIDCDLRRPSIHQLFELPAQPGLSEVLLGEIHPAEAILATPVDGLWVMPAGQWDRNVMQALARDEAQGVFEKLRGEYDFVVVDTHPVLPATDSLLIGQHADAVIFSLLRDVSQMPKVYAACQRLTSLGIRVLGAVINGTKEDVYGNRYQYTAQPQQAANE